MSRVRKRVCLALVVALMMFSIAAEDSVFIGDGDIGGIRMYDSQGVALDATVEVASNIGEGWIIHNPDSPILIITPKGSINLYEDSILITGDLISNNPSLYLVKGKATFNTYDMEGGTLSVSTPVSLFKLKGDGEMFVITDDVEESVTVFQGVGTSYNSITRATRTITAFQKLGMQESLAKPKPIASGYYLTYATYPDLMLAKQLISDMATAKIEIPSVPKFSSVLLKPQQAPPPAIQKGVTIMPAKAPSFASIETAEPAIPPKPYSITVTSEPVKVPAIPQSLTSSLLSPPKNRIVVTVKPMAPEVPSVANIVIEVESIAVVEPALIPVVTSDVLVEPSEAVGDAEALPEVTEPAGVEAAAKPEATEPVVTETVPERTEPVAVAEPEKPAPGEETAPKQEKTQGVLSTQEEDIKEGSVGIQASYSFLFDGTDSDKMLHTLALKPYFTYKSVALTLQSSVSTEDFSTFTSNVTPVPTGNLEMLSYGFKFISSARIGYISSPFFLALDNNQYHSALTRQYFAPRFGDSAKLGLYNRIEIGSFSTTLYFDDLYLTNLLASPSKSQFSSFALGYAKQDGYRFSVSLGTLAKIEYSPTRTVNLYPNVNFSFPLIDVRTTQLALLVAASGYLPAYPTFDSSQFIDTSLTSLFPNYQVGAGLTLNQGPFSAKLMGSFRKGENRNLLTSDLAYAYDTANSVFDILAETGFAGEHFTANLTVNLPFASDLSLASETGATNKADFSQITLAYMQKAFTFSLGLQQVGIGETFTGIVDGSKDVLALFGGARATSFLSVGYTTGGLTIKAKASYPADPTVYTTPKITITASYKLGVQF